MGGMPDIPEQPKEKSVYTYNDGELVSSKEVNGDTVTTKQVSSAQEQANKKQRQQDLATVEDMMRDFLPTLNSVDPELLKQIDAQAATMSDSAGNQLNNSYNETMKTLQDTANARFGSTQNAYYDKERDSINKTLAEQQSQMAKDIEGRKADLKQQELGNKQTYYNNMQGWAGNLRNDVNDFRDMESQKYNQNLQASQISNNFDASTYATYMSGVQSQIAAQAQKQSSFMGMFSDVALKQNIKPVESVLDKLNKCGVYNFNYIGSTDNEVGCMAQQIEKEFPDLVSEKEGYKIVNYGGLVPILVQAVRELNSKLGG